MKKCRSSTKSFSRKPKTNWGSVAHGDLKKNLDPQIKKGVTAKNPTTLDKVKNIAILKEKAWLALQSQQPPSTLEKSGELTCVIDVKNQTQNESRD